MAQTVNEVTDLMSDKTRRPNSKLQVPTSGNGKVSIYGTGLRLANANINDGRQSVT